MRQPYAVILLDEVEKAHPDVFNALLQVFDEGRLTDAQGRTVNFKNTIIVMTSNIGSQIIADAKSPVTAEELMPEIRKFFRIEFINRIDEIIAFQPLKLEQMEKIAVLRFRDLAKRLLERGITSELKPAAAKAIADLSFDPRFGARPINRFMQTHLENPLSRKIIAGELLNGQHLVVDFQREDFVFIVQGIAIGLGDAEGVDGPGSKSDASKFDDEDIEDGVFTEVD